MKRMVISLSPPGIKCQVGDFVMLALPSVALAKEGRLPKANLILYTEVGLPVGFPLPPNLVAGAGEYEISGVRVKGVSLEKEKNNGQLFKTVYLAELEGIRLAFLGELESESIDEIIDKLGTVDILFLSVPHGGTKQITTLIKQVD